MSPLYIAYCEENHSVASEIVQKLKKAKVKFSPLSSKLSKDAKGLTHLIADSNSAGILLLSDNFLKSETCMQNMLSFVQNSSVAENMQVVVIDGQYSSGDVETSFDRVSSVIKYMNFWQERYLAMRKKKRTIDPSKESIFNDSLLNVKNISSEIGDFLRLIRNKDFWTYDQLIYNNFEVFFKKFGKAGQHQAYIKVAGSTPVVTTATKIKASLPPVVVPPTPHPTPATNKTGTTPEKTSDSAFQPIGNPMDKPKEVVTKAPLYTPENSLSEKGEKDTTPSINEMLAKAKEKSKAIETPKTLHEKLAAKLNQEKIIPANDLKKEEEDIEEILEEVKSMKTSHVSKQINENILPDLGNRIEVLSTPETIAVPDEFEEVFKDESIETELEDVEEELEIEDVVIEDDNDFLSDTFEEEEIEEVENEEFDFMDGVEVDDITDEFEEFEEELEIEEEEEIEPVMDDNGMSLSAAMSAANAFMMSGAHREGIKAFETLLEDYPDSVEIRYRFAHNLREEVSDQEKATVHFEKIVKLDPNHYPSYKALAEISEQNNDFLLAKSYYEKVVNLKPDEPGIYYKLALITAGFYSEKPKIAAKYFKKAIQQDPYNEDAYYRYGLILSDHLGKDKKALSNFLKTLEINALHPFANYDLALLYHKMGDQRNAAKYYAQAWKINPELKTEENDTAFHYEESEELKTPSQPVHKKQRLPHFDNDKTILITGATSGIGRATAIKFAEHGFKIIITGRREERLETLKSEFENTYNTKVKTLHFDVRNQEEVKSMINNLEEEWRNIDVLINNAGLAKGYAPIHEGDIDHWDTMIDTNIKGLLYLTRAVAPHMVAKKSGHIINVCSTAGKEVYSNGNVYCATKHAVDSLTKAMRLDLYKHNIRVGQVSPAHVEETEFAVVRFEDAEKAKIYNDFQPLKSSDVADAIFYIANTPPHVNVQDILLMGKQQANSSNIDRSGREEDRG